MKYLLSLPPGIVEPFHRISGLPADEWFVSSDPGGQRVGSGGGTAHLLASLFHRENPGVPFDTWLGLEKRLIIHAGGQSRRLPAYAPTGKSLMPFPVVRWSRGQRLNQRLIHLQVPLLQKILENAPATLNTLVASGDVLVTAQGPLPPFPDADIICFGTWTTPEAASRHGVFFVDQGRPGELAFMLQKPSVDDIQKHVHHCFFLMDMGIWLLNDKATGLLMQSCGWSGTGFPGQMPAEYDLYGSFGPAMGTRPVVGSHPVNQLNVAVINLENGHFYHFGSSRELISAHVALQNLVVDQREIWHKKIKPHPSVFILNSATHPRPEEKNHSLWIENAHIPESWALENSQILTNIPENQWTLRLPAGTCLDMVSLPGGQWVVRPYGFTDTFSGHPAHPDTRFLGQPLRQWLERRGLASILDDPDLPADIHNLPLFPVVDPAADESGFVQWLIDEHPADNDVYRNRWGTDAIYGVSIDAINGVSIDAINGVSTAMGTVSGNNGVSIRYSAAQLGNGADIAKIETQRTANRAACLPLMERNHANSIFYQLDLDDLAREIVAAGIAGATTVETPLMASLPPSPPGDTPPPPTGGGAIHYHMLQAQIQRLQGHSPAADEEAAFASLRESILEHATVRKVMPRMNLLDDQIAWGRSPVRLDLAGGWSDTPPYCILYGGQVVNVAVELNGQPPLQCFVRRHPEPDIRIRSIDLGVGETLKTFDDIRAYGVMQSAFPIVKAALALAGFVPEFCSARFPHLETQLRELGGGLEITILSAVPKGSGLGASSILGATVLAAMSDACHLGWSRTEIGNLTLALEQMLTTGGGWQDQYGGILEGIKYLETAPGYAQQPLVRWLPDNLFTRPDHTGSILLYYTGITRMAKNILAEIVRGMFLNAADKLRLLHEIREHGLTTFNALQMNDFSLLGQSVARSWDLNQRLDAGTNTPQIQQIINQIAPLASGWKLLGAGGGGFMLIIAKDPGAAARIRNALNASPPNARARFVDLQLSRSGMEVTKS